MAAQLLSESDAQVGPLEFDLGRVHDRQSLLQRRKELMSQRMALLEEREALYAARAEALERAESQVGDLEGKLVRRESAVSDTARKVFSAASSLEDDDDSEPAPSVTYTGASSGAATGHVSVGRGQASAPAATSGRGQAAGSASASRVRHLTPALDVTTQAAVRSLEPSTTPRTGSFSRVPAEAQRPEEPLRDGPAIAGEPMRMASGETEHIEDDDEGLSGVSRAEDKATRKRASARARVRTNQFKITLEAHLDHGEPHHFFRYENDGPTDLPGLFIATPNLLKVGREVRIRVGRAGQFLEATGIVAWRRQRGDAGGTPGMGIELLNLSEPERNVVGKWITDKAPITI